MDTFKVGSTFVVSFQWRLQDDILLWASFRVRVQAIVDDTDRLLCRFEEILSLRTSEPPETVDDVILNRVKEIVGQYAHIPPEAARGKKLYLKLTTLTGQHDYFSASPPTNTDNT